MKTRSNWTIYAVWFLFGAMLSYFLCQYKWLNINTEINVVDTVLTGSTAILGLYIATIIQKRHNRNQNLYNFCEARIFKAWNTFAELNGNLTPLNNIPVTRLNLTIKELFKEINYLKLAISAHKSNSGFIAELESKIDELESFISNNSRVQNNQYEIGGIKPQVVQRMAEIDGLFSKALAGLNKI